jgi:cyclomaltodextrinase
MPVPEWVQDAIFYQIFPDRFANGNKDNDPSNVRSWDSSPTTWDFQGGDLEGIIQRFDYLLDLGINAIYLNPIFLSTSNHRYNTTDYFRVDPKLGDLKDFKNLLAVAHQNGVRVILDGVFNHCGRGFFAFNDILENQEHSPYLNWFHIKYFPVNAYSPGDARDYVGWWGLKSLPKFNTDEPQVRKYLLSVAKYWIEIGADGWRLDVPNEIDDDSFWAELREVVKTANPEAYLLGEIWTADARWVGEQHFDGLMNYPVRDAVLRLLYAGTLDISHFKDKMEHLFKIYPRENLHAMYVPLGSHDTERLLTKVDNDIRKVKLAFLFQFAIPGAPAVYMGDEIGLTGGKDPECRGAFPWNPQKWNMSIFEWVKLLIRLRREKPVLRKGDIQCLCADPSDGCLAFTRSLGDDKIIVSLNAGPVSQQVQIMVAESGYKDGTKLKGLFSGKEYIVNAGKLTVTLDPWNGDWIT